MTESVLGVVLAGGRSTRFGSDKAAALYDGISLLDHAIAALTGFCDEVVVAGRDTAPVRTVQDWPKADFGPLGGLAGGLRAGADRGFRLILSVGVDCLGYPCNLRELLAPAPGFLWDQPVVGLWPTDTLEALETILTDGGSRSVKRFAEVIGARPVELGAPLENINTPAALEGYAGPHG
ncbi:molybdenum cofactor guanylyltransferase [Qipengyuania atrilutea]|uniref:NTP transferase domain-containing protein n=1 Tax=Qipengyuania atrilutea TaxID=2744473 RepID=A0A850H5Z0_9SPHN|nr:NTP transferase domain-containing protein [Actirhodobacter atriluteus]NVD45907.1 NTP transferase domain-containing protein [Actirhodobacter atriluteus]